MPPAGARTEEPAPLFSEDVICDNDGRIGIVTRTNELLDEEDDMDEPPVPDGSAEVCWLESEEPVVLPVDALHVVDRCFLHGDIVGRSADPAGQTGTVVNVSIEVDVRWVHSGQTALGVDVKQLRHIAPVTIGSFVVKGKWLGRVEECMDTVYVRFADKSLCKITETNLDELEPVRPTPLLDEAHPYFPGQMVRGAQAFKHAHWIRGGKYKPSKHKQGKVVRVRPYMLAVAWVANQGMSDQDASPNEEFIKVSDVEHLGHFSWTWWQVGDRGLLPHPDVQTSTDEGSSGAVATGAVPARRYERKLGSRSRRRQSRQQGCHCAGAGASAGCKDQEHDCVEIVRSRTKVDVRWQDTTLDTNVSARELVPVLPDGNDFQPGDFVVEKGEDDPSAGVQASVPLTRTGVVRRVNASERTCGVAWSKVEAGHPSTIEAGSPSNHVDSSSSPASEPGIVFASGTDAVLSVYELVPHPDFSFRRGLPVLRLATNSGEVLSVPVSTEPGTDATPVLTAGTDGDTSAGASDANQGCSAPRSTVTESSALQPESTDVHGGMDASDAAEDNSGGGDDDSSDWETDEDEDQMLTAIMSEAPTDGGPPMYGEVLEVCEDTGHVRVCWTDRSIQLVDPSGLFIVPDDEEGDMLDDGQYGSDGGWETASDTGSEQADGALGNQLAAVMQQYENEEAQQASIFGQTPSSQHATAVPTIGSETVPATAGVVGEVSVATNDVNSTAPTCSIGVQSSTRAGPSTYSGTITSECVDGGVDTPPPASFDCIEGTFSDHRFADRSGSATNPRQFGRRVTKEWGLLSGSLPPGIYVRACEEHMDLLRAVMFGPAETPYEDSCFFFDILLPADYPNTPPEVSYFSYGERLNPNLYETGKVCLSLLGTWSGQEGENWNSKSSNILQVLISIQGLVLVEEPFYNEPGFEKQIGTEDGRVKSMRYNEGALLFTIRALNRSLRSLPEHTEAICKHEFANSRAKRLCTRLQALLMAQPDSARPYGSAGFLRTLRKLFPTTEETMRKFMGAMPTPPSNVAADMPNAQAQARPDPESALAPAPAPAPAPEPEPEPEPEPNQPLEQAEAQSSSDDDSDL